MANAQLCLEFDNNKLPALAEPLNGTIFRPETQTFGDLAISYIGAKGEGRRVARLSRTFREAADNYAARKPSQRKYLAKICEHIGDMYLADIVPIMIKDLAEKLYPD